MHFFWRLPLPRASKQCVWVRTPEVQPPYCNVAYARSPYAQASQRVPILELTSAHASITPAHTMPAAPFICFCSSCGHPGKGSEAVSVVVGAHGAGRAVSLSFYTITNGPASVDKLHIFIHVEIRHRML